MNSNKVVQYPFACKYDRADWNRSELTDYPTFRQMRASSSAYPTTSLTVHRAELPNC
jgi:hypothetical protein